MKPVLDWRLDNYSFGVDFVSADRLSGPGETKTNEIRLAMAILVMGCLLVRSSGAGIPQSDVLVT
jgi:hypothetical protein